MSYLHYLLGEYFQANPINLIRESARSFNGMQCCLGAKELSFVALQKYIKTLTTKAD